MKHDLDMRLNLDVEPGLGAIMRAEIEAGEKAVMAAMRDAGLDFNISWREQVIQAGLGERLARTVKNKTYKNKESGEGLNAVALIYTKAPVIMSAHDTGVLIRSRNGRFLAVPLPAAGKGRWGARMTPKRWQEQNGMKLRFVSRRKYGKPPLLVADGRLSSRGLGVASRSKTGRGRSTVPIFVLVPQVKLSKRLDLDRIARQAADRVPGLIAAKWEQMD